MSSAATFEPRVVWEPRSLAQHEFLTCPAYECLFEGRRFCGKTDALLMDYAQHVGAGWGEVWRGAVFRKTYDQLQDVIAKSLRWFPRIFPTAKYNQASHFWKWPDGERLFFRSIADPRDYERFHGWELPWVGWEELTNWPSGECYERMKSVNRAPVKGVAKKCRATTNPWGPGHCVPYGEVLTPDRGWVRIQIMQVGDAVYTVDSRGEMVVSEVGQVHRARYDGPLRRVENRGVKLLCTPGHRMPKQGGTRLSPNRLFSLLPFDELPGDANLLRRVAWSGEELDTFEVPHVSDRGILDQPKSLSGDDYAELMGWYASEGYTVLRKGECLFGISQLKTENRDRIRALLDRCGFKYRERSTRFSVASWDWGLYFRSFGLQPKRFLPRELLSASRRQLEILLDALMRGDGCEGAYYTSSKRLSEDVEEIALKTGHLVYAFERQRPDRETRSYEVRMKTNESGCSNVQTGNHRYRVETSSQSAHVQTEPYRGDVYCIGVPDTHTFLLKQDGCVWVSGNSWVRRRFVEPIPPSIIHTDDSDGLTRARVTGEIIPELVENDPEYYQRLKSIPDPQLRKAWLEGRWDVVIGGMFDDLWDESVHVVEPFRIPKRWRKDRSLDWGSASPFSVLWWAEANGESVEIRGHPTDVPRGTLFLFAEWYGEKADDPGKGLRLQARAVAKGIQEYERRMAGHLYEGSVSGGPADTAIWSEESDGANIADRFAAEGVRWTKANKRPGSRIQGVEAMRDRLESTAMRPRERPGLHVFDSCRSWLAHVPILQRDEKNPDDVDTDQEDHDWDATMYRLLERRHTRRVRDLPQ